MTFKKSNKREGLTRKLAETIFLSKDDGLDMIMKDSPETYEIHLDRKRIMTFSEKERTIRLEEPYMFLPESLRNLVDGLKGAGYKTVNGPE